MTRKEIKTRELPISCDVCGRTLLRGEHPEVYLAGGSRRQVCELCTARAGHEGWIRESAVTADLRQRRVPYGSRRGLMERLRARRELPGELPPEAVDPPFVPSPYLANVSEQLELGASEPYEAPLVPEAAPVAHLEAESSGLQDAGYDPLEAGPTQAEMKINRAVAVFNAGEGPRRVAGIARSLGTPVVAVSPDETRPSVVRIVVAWELSWYRYEVDLADEAAGARVAEQGYELSELNGAVAAPNASLDERGILALVS